MKIRIWGIPVDTDKDDLLKISAAINMATLLREPELMKGVGLIWSPDKKVLQARFERESSGLSIGPEWISGKDAEIVSGLDPIYWDPYQGSSLFKRVIPMYDDWWIDKKEFDQAMAIGMIVAGVAKMEIGLLDNCILVNFHCKI